jgi:hypothetical protein
MCIIGAMYSRGTNYFTLQPSLLRWASSLQDDFPGNQEVQERADYNFSENVAGGVCRRKHKMIKMSTQEQG